MRFIRKLQLSSLATLIGFLIGTGLFSFLNTYILFLTIHPDRPLTIAIIRDPAFFKGWMRAMLAACIFVLPQFFLFMILYTLLSSKMKNMGVFWLLYFPVVLVFFLFLYYPPAYFFGFKDLIEKFILGTSILAGLLAALHFLNWKLRKHEMWMAINPH